MSPLTMRAPEPVRPSSGRPARDPADGEPGIPTEEHFEELIANLARSAGPGRHASGGAGLARMSSTPFRIGVMVGGVLTMTLIGLGLLWVVGSMLG